MKKKIHSAAVVSAFIVLSLLIFSYSVRRGNDLKGSDNVPCTEEAGETYDKKNQFDLPFLESLTRHLLALGH
ncbi:MAG: hypothetical protein ACTHMM_11230 [Agriterribacter sp.]